MRLLLIILALALFVAAPAALTFAAVLFAVFFRWGVNR